MDLARIAELNLTFEHRHDDGTLGTFEPETRTLTARPSRPGARLGIGHDLQVHHL